MIEIRCDVSIKEYKGVRILNLCKTETIKRDREIEKEGDRERDRIVIDGVRDT